MKTIALFALAVGSLLTTQAQSIKGAWKAQQPNNSTAALLVADNYLVISAYNVLNKNFDRTEGGRFTLVGDQLTYTPEFNTTDTSKVGVPVIFTIERKKDILSMKSDDTKWVWMLIDDAQKVPMGGAWHITERANDKGDLVKIHQTGTRKTLKVLTGTRFQWFAIDPGVKGFYGTGGGTYTIKDGKYTENIEFFSRDSNRVGASLSFDWALKNGRWDHSGKSSAGAPIHEIWEKIP